MSCNGCRVLRKGCGESCVLRASLRGIESPEAQAHATLFLAKFFGRSDLLSFIASVPDHQRPALFHSLLYEACGRTVNPVNGAVGLLSTGNWHLCEAALGTVLRGGSIGPIPGLVAGARVDASSERFSTGKNVVQLRSPAAAHGMSLPLTPKLETGRRSGRRTASSADESDLTTSFESGERRSSSSRQEKKLLNLFV